MRLRAGILLGIVPFLLISMALPSTFYTIHAVGPDFRTVGPDGPQPEDEVRQLDGEWTLFHFRFFNETWSDQDANPEGKWTVQRMAGGGDGPNSEVGGLYSDVLVVIAAGVGALALGVFGAWNIAARDRYRWFTAASFFLAALLFLGGCYVFAFTLPEAMHADAQGVHVEAYGVLFQHYIDPEGGEPGYYFEFEGSYPNTDPRLREQLEYAPGWGWWLAGAAGVAAIVAAAVLVGAPSLAREREDSVQVEEVVRYVPVPSVEGAKRRRRYPKRMPAVSRRSPSLKRERRE